MSQQESLEQKTLRVFDELVLTGDVVFSHAPPSIIPSTPFNIQLRVANSLTKKPQVDIKQAQQQQRQNEKDEQREKNEQRDPSAASPLPKKPANQPPKSPFDRDPPAFAIAHPTSSHTLRLNKFPVVRPQFVLHTNRFHSQLTPLSRSDLAAGVAALAALPRRKYMLIFNGGAWGGWSLPHRHMQILPVVTGKGPEVGGVGEGEDEGEFELWPDLLGISDDGHVPNITLRHAIARLPVPLSAETAAAAETTARIIDNEGNTESTPTSSKGSNSPLPFPDLHPLYTDILARTGVGPHNEQSHNLILTHDWILLIPRSKGSLPVPKVNADDSDEVSVINAAVMVGMVWVSSNRVAELWWKARREGRVMEVIRELGFEWE